MFRKQRDRKKLILRSMLALVSLLFILNIPPVFGHGSGGYSHDSSIGYSNPDWMAALPDSLRLSELSIPGTHDTMSFYGGDAVQCQSMSLATQLNSGIRVLDIRCRHIEDHFAIHHGSVFQNAMFGVDVLTPVVDFLRAHPSETVLMRVKEEHDPENNTRSFAQTFEWYLNAAWYYDGNTPLAPYGQWVWQPNGDNPTLGEVRGKIVILDNFAGGQYGINWTDAKIQDWYHFTTNWDLDDKWYKIRDHVIAADTGSMDDIYINFLSGSGGSFPYFVASGHSSPGTGHPRLWTGMLWDNVTGSTCGSTNCYPFFPRLNCVTLFGIKTCSVFFEGTNEILTYYWLKNGLVNHRTGIIMADFPGSALIEEIITLNPWNWPPDANANGPYVGTENSEIGFDASGSSDPDGDALQYRWDFNDDGSWDTGWSSDPTAGYTWYDDWEGTVKVEVSDGTSTATATAAVTINNVAPVVTAAGSTIDENGWATVSGTITDPGIQDTFILEINWGEGSPQTYNYPAGTTTYSEQHQYLDDNPTGTPLDVYSISVNAEDDDGGTGATNTSVTVNNVAPVVSLDSIQDESGAEIPDDVPVALVHLEIEAVGSFTDIGTQDTHTAIMDWGDGSTNDLGSVAGTTNASHIYANPGNYEPSLFVTDDDTGLGTASAQIRVVDAADGIEVVIEELIAQAGDPNVSDALDKLRGENDGEAENGALDKLDKGNLNTALEKLGQALRSLEPVNLPYIKGLLALTAKSAVMDTIKQVEAGATKQNELGKIQKAKDLVTQGDSLLAASDYLGAVDKYQQAAQEVQGISQ